MHNLGKSCQTFNLPQNILKETKDSKPCRGYKRREQSDFLISFDSIPHEYFKVSAYITPNLASDILLSYEFQKDHHITIDFQKKSIIMGDTLINSLESEVTEKDDPDQKLIQYSVGRHEDKKSPDKLAETLESIPSQNRVEIGCYEIILRDKTPIFCKPFRIPDSIKEQLKDEIKDLLQRGIIKESSSNFALPTFPIIKKKK